MKSIGSDSFDFEPMGSAQTPLISPSLFPQQPQHQRKRQRDQDAGGDRKIEVKPVALDADIAGQVAQAQFGKPGPQQADDDQNNAKDDEQLCHWPGSGVGLLLKLRQSRGVGKRAKAGLCVRMNSHLQVQRIQRGRLL